MILVKILKYFAENIKKGILVKVIINFNENLIGCWPKPYRILVKILNNFNQNLKGC